MRIVLSGYPGTGTSSTGRVLAGLLGLPFVDLDELIASHAGMSRLRLAQVHGEDEARKIEEAAFADALTLPACVVASGTASLPAGASGALVVRLTAEPAVILLRTAGSLEDRMTVLKSRDAIETVRGLVRDREAGMPQPNRLLDTTDLTPEQAAEKILEALPRTAQGGGQQSA